ncbi:proton-coupled folate transporter-like [Amphiura filiformis]|uniref:proton-coupled folate transporter-like n=1 Tax=Amphiura filiformis TaxID=82378 RepID=UPI003B21FD44
MEFTDERLSPPPSPTTVEPDEDQLSDETPLLPVSVKRASSRRVTVEPIVLFASIIIGVFITLSPQYLKQRLADARNYTLPLDEYGENGTCSQNSSDPDYIIEQEIQADVSLWSMIITISSYFPSLFTAPIIGAWGDKVGRKFAIGLPIIGFTLSAIVYLFVLYFSLPLWVIAIAYFLQGVTGNYGLLLAGAYAYIADVTTKEKRMIRIVIIQAIFVLGIGLSQILVGMLIAAVGFAACLWLGLIGLLLCLIYVTVPPFLIETIVCRNSQEITHIIDKSRLESVIELFRHNTNRRQLKLILLLLIAFTTEILGQASLNVTIIYGLGPPFCWGSVTVGWYSAMVLLLSAAGMILGSKGFALCFSDTWIIQIGMIFGVANGLFNAFARNTSELFLAAALTAPRAVDQPMFHLMLSKLVNADEQGVMFACESSVLNLSSFISPLFLNSIYSATVQTQPNSVFLAMAAARIVPLCLIVALQIVNRLNPDITLGLPVDRPTILEKVHEDSKKE